MRFIDVAMIAANTDRSKAYLQALLQHGIYPSFVIIMVEKRNQLLPGQSENEKIESDNNVNGKVVLDIAYNPAESIENTLQSSDIPFMLIPQTDINCDEVIKAISSRDESVFIYSGYGGQILKKKVLDIGKLFLHVHGGYLPDYKGSTTNYYSLILDNECGASSLFLNEKIDSGRILIRRKYPPPENKKQIDYIFDPIIRAKVLVGILQASANSSI